MKENVRVVQPDESLDPPSVFSRGDLDVLVALVLLKPSNEAWCPPKITIDRILKKKKIDRKENLVIGVIHGKITLPLYLRPEFCFGWHTVAS